MPSVHIFNPTTGAGGTPTAAAGGLTTVNLGSGTSANDAQFDGSTTWGTQSTIVAAATHGRLDSGLDAGVRFSEPLEPPAGARGLHIKVTMLTPPGSNSTGGVAELYMGAATQPLLAIDEGYQAAWRISVGGDVKLSSATETWGNILGSGGTTTGVMTMDMIVWLGPTGAAGTLAVAASTFQMGSTSGLIQTNEGTDLATSVSNLYAYVGVGMVAASPSATITWADVTLETEWLM